MHFIVILIVTHLLTFVVGFLVSEHYHVEMLREARIELEEIKKKIQSLIK